jgi:SAM-dependent methyltransferase
MTADDPFLDFDGDYGRTYGTGIRRLIPGYDALLEIALAAEADLTLVEPSAPMARLCRQRIQELGETHRCRLLPCPLEEAGLEDGSPFAAVLAQHVLHLFPPDRQEGMARRLAALVAPGGVLLVSGHCKDGPASLYPIALRRLAMAGLDGATIERIRATGNTELFPIGGALLENVARACALSPPDLLFEPLLNRLWLLRRPGDPEGREGER